MEPKILSQNTYYWRSGSTASQRRSNEKRRLSEVESFLLSLNFEIILSGNEFIKAKKDNIEVAFSYSESCRNVYKKLSVKKDGKRSNITTLRKLYK